MNNPPRLNLWADYRDRLGPIDDQTDAEVTTLLNSLDESSCKDVLKRIRSRRDNLSLSSESTHHVLGVCGQLLGLGAAGLALSVEFFDKIRQFEPLVQKIVVSVGIVYIELVLVSLLVLILYMLHARFRYPFLYFRKIGNTWPWFYYTTISPNVSRRAVQTPQELLHAADRYAGDFLEFSRKAISETHSDEVRNELQHISCSSATRAMSTSSLCAWRISLCTAWLGLFRPVYSLRLWCFGHGK